MMKHVLIASDHNGNSARAWCMRVLKDMGIDHIDLGPPDGVKVDYVDFAERLCRLKYEDQFGILICGTGAGMCIAANRFPNVRAALVTDEATAILAREHNDANVLVMGQWRTSLEDMGKAVRAFMSTPFEGGRHLPRLEKLRNLKP